MRAGIAVLIATVALCCPALAQAASVTVTGPNDGQTFHTGSNERATVTLSATLSPDPCRSGTWYIDYKRSDGAGFATATGGGIDKTTLSITREDFPGDYLVRGRLECVNPDGADAQSGTITYHVVGGDPPQDVDNDGLVEPEDQCPKDAGPADNHGCPRTTPTDPNDPPDPPNPGNQDSDGVPDAEDRCPNSAGPEWNDGCQPRAPAAPRGNRERNARSSRSARCSLAKLRAEKRGAAPKFNGNPQVARLKRCYAKDVPGVPDGWPLITFWASSKFKPAFDVFPPDLRPANSPPITVATLRAKPGFNVYAVKHESSKGVVGLPVFSILTSVDTPTNAGRRLQVGVLFPGGERVGRYKRVRL
jgi:hypothetical protein